MIFLENYVQNELHLLEYMAYIEIATGVVVFLVLQFIAAPYGRYGSSNWGPQIPGKIAWFLQELPAFCIPFGLIFLTGAPKLQNTTNCVMLGMYLLHYFQRAFIFPFLLRGGKPTPLIPFVLALAFCAYNGYLQGRYLTEFGTYHENWLFSGRTIIGVIMFFMGLMINIHSDDILRNLRKPGETGYKIPQGGMFEYVSGSNFFGEILEWCGFMVVSWSLPAAAFFVFTAGNIAPRAMSHHRWYLEKFKDEYPRSRKAVIPFIL